MLFLMMLMILMMLKIGSRLMVYIVNYFQLIKLIKNKIKSRSNNNTDNVKFYFSFTKLSTKDMTQFLLTKISSKLVCQTY